MCSASLKRIGSLPAKMLYQWARSGNDIYISVGVNLSSWSWSYPGVGEESVRENEKKTPSDSDLKKKAEKKFHRRRGKVVVRCVYY